jgi:alpha-D-xyloside xylohydrolase
MSEPAGSFEATLRGARGFCLGPARERIPVQVQRRQRCDEVVELVVAAPGASTVGIALPCDPHEHFAGFGEQFTQLDKRGRIIDGWLFASVNAATGHSVGLDGGYKIAPLYYSSAGYAAFLDTTLRWRFDLAVSNPYEVVVTLPASEICLTVVRGMPRDAITLVTSLTGGRPPLVEPWAYGVWKNMAGDEDAILAEARRMRELEMPCSAVWLYAFYEPSTNTGCGTGGTYGTGSYPDLAGTVRKLHELDYRALSYLNPFLYKDTPFMEEAAERGFVVGDLDGKPLLGGGFHPVGDENDQYDKVLIHTVSDGNGTIDLSNPEAQCWWRSKLRQILLGEGFDGWMQDFGEGVHGAARLHDGGVAADAHNRYPLLYHATAFEEIQQSKPDALFFARGAYLGSQAHVPVMWPGDQTRDWSRECGIGSIPAAGISAGLMGVAAWGPDIAGAMGYAEPNGYGDGSGDKELWIRWCQLGAMAPVMREHLGFHRNHPVDAWTDEETIDTWRRCARWHLSLFPYLYTCAVDASRTGLPIVRGLMIEFPEEPESWVASTEYMLGPSLLCAPVLEAGARTRALRLPPGAWYDWWTGVRYEGSQWVEVPAPLDRWPVFQREGSVIPLLSEIPLSLNSPVYKEGRFDIELRLAGAHAVETLFDGTVIDVAGDRVTAHGPVLRSYRLLRAGAPAALVSSSV